MHYSRACWCTIECSDIYCCVHWINGKIVNDSWYCRALERVSIASALSSALTIYPCQIRVHQMPTVLNSNFLQLGWKSGGRPQRTVYPRRLPANFRLLVRRATSRATETILLRQRCNNRLCIAVLEWGGVKVACSVHCWRHPLITAVWHVSPFIIRSRHTAAHSGLSQYPDATEEVYGSHKFQSAVDPRITGQKLCYSAFYWFGISLFLTNQNS